MFYVIHLNYGQRLKERKLPADVHLDSYLKAAISGALLRQFVGFSDCCVCPMQAPIQWVWGW